jgi:hypothetical protein
MSPDGEGHGNILTGKFDLENPSGVSCTLRWRIAAINELASFLDT